jgi:hypothetical protein
MKVFISHSSVDSWIARHISTDISALGIETFLDSKDIETGQSIDDLIGSHLEDSDELLILVSPAALRGQWVFLEAGGAHALKKRLIPILLHVSADEIPLPIARYLARDLNDIDRYYEELRVRTLTYDQAKLKSVSTIKSQAAQRSRELKVGDRVRVHNRLPDDQDEPPMWNEEMSQYLGKEATIIRKAPPNRLFPDTEAFFLDVDQASWLWSPRWLDLVWPPD